MPSEPISVVTRDGTPLTTQRSAEGVVIVDAIPIKKRKVDLRDRLARALEPLAVQARDADIGFTIHATPDELPPVVVDDAKIVWAVASLVGNSLRYVRHGTRHRPGGSIAIDLHVGHGELRIDASDDGPGMPVGAAAVLRGDGAATTNAPALALLHDVITAQGGRIDVRSSQDTIEHGTTVSIHLPI